jgi:hypothetical protein
MIARQHADPSHACAVSDIDYRGNVFEFQLRRAIDEQHPVRTHREYRSSELR